MSSLADRLRGIVSPSPATSTEQALPAAYLPRDADPGRGANPVRAASSVARTSQSDAAEVLGGDWHQAGHHSFLIVDRRYSPGHRHGRIAIADAAPPVEGWPRLNLLCSGLRDQPDGSAPFTPSRCLFLDLETTGLAGGAGTYAFLVGLAWFDGGTFRVRQFFLSSHAAERALLEAVCRLADDTATVVTYNGKSFDLPVLETRYVINRMATPFAGMPHVDMLHPARRLWRSESVTDDEGRSSCRLTALEETLCGHEREGDVPGFEIPARYFHYVRTGEARQLQAVLEHNRLDLISLALLTARAAQLLEDGPPAAMMAREALGLGQLYERAGLATQARAAYVRAVAFPSADVATRAEALRALALAWRRAHRYHDAADAWRQLLDLHACPASIAREATEALAVHHEHRLRDPLSARTFALHSLRLPSTAARRDALHHRLARLNRKLGNAEGTPLF